MEIKFSPRMLKGTIDAMPSKSHAHRLLIAMKLAELQGRGRSAEVEAAVEHGRSAEVEAAVEHGQSTEVEAAVEHGQSEGLEIPPFSEDIKATIRCLSQLDKSSPYLECGESGSTLRFLLPVVMALKSSATFLGTGRLPDRPLSPLREEMECHGCSFQMGSNKNTDKFKEICSVHGALQPGEYFLAGDVSSQFVTGLLFALPLLEGDSVLTLTTELESAGYVELTLDVLKKFGVLIGTGTSEDGFAQYYIEGNQTFVKPERIALDGDWSNSAFWLAAGALSGDITIKGLSLESCQWDKEIVNILAQMGANLEIKNRPDGLVDIRAAASNLKGVEVDVSQIPDLTPVLSVLMTFAEGTSMICHGERLKFKESNRMKTIYSMLYNLGADISYGGDRLSFTGTAYLDGGITDSYNDHRVAMAAAIASCLSSEDIYLQNPVAITKSYPNFYKDFEVLGGELEYLWNHHSEKK